MTTDLKLPKIIAWRYTHTLFRHGAHEMLLIVAHVEEEGGVTCVLGNGIGWEKPVPNVKLVLSSGTKEMMNDVESWWEPTHSLYRDGVLIRVSEVKLFADRKGLVTYSYFGDRGCMCEDGEDAPSVEVVVRKDQ